MLTPIVRLHDRHRFRAFGIERQGAATPSLTSQLISARSFDGLSSLGLAGCGHDTNYAFMQLTAEMQNIIYNGATPVPPRDRRRYYDLVSASLRKCPLLTNAALMNAIRAAQRELLRPPAEAA